MIEAGIYTLLSTASSINALCGTRITPSILPENAVLPAITYKVIAAKPSPTFDTSGFQRWRIQFDCWGNSYGDVVGLREAIRAFLEGYRGVLSDGTLLQDAQFIQLGDLFADDAQIFRVMVEFYLFFGFQN